MFGTTGLHLVGAKAFGMSLNQAQDFYGFLEKVFYNKLAGNVQAAIRDRLSNAFSFPITGEENARMAEVIRGKYARSEMHKIIECIHVSRIR